MRTVLELGQRPEIQVRMTGSEAGDAVSFAEAASVRPGQEPLDTWLACPAAVS
jgi:hypothetical protein